VSEPGPLGEEAARLMAALESWMRGAGGGLGQRMATGADECQLCPFCRVLTAVRASQPEAFAHLLDAATSLAAALRVTVDAGTAHSEPPPVEHIDIS
jgi:hypothetical protein